MISVFGGASKMSPVSSVILSLSTGSFLKFDSFWLDFEAVPDLVLVFILFCGCGLLFELAVVDISFAERFVLDRVERDAMFEDTVQVSSHLRRSASTSPTCTTGNQGRLRCLTA